MSDPSTVHRILIIDDNKSIHEDISGFLKQAAVDSLELIESELFGAEIAENDESPAFELHSAFQGQEALEMVEESVRNDARYSIAFVDVRMPPGWDGIETIEQIWKVDPNLEMVICTAYSDYSWNHIVNRLGYNDRFLILKKPFEGIEVRQLAMSLAAKVEFRKNQAQQHEHLEREVERRSVEMVDAKDRAERANKAKSDFLANMSHEIRTPLNGVVGMLELLGTSGISEEQSRFLRGAQTSADCLLTLITDLLDFSKIEAGRLDLDPIEFDLRSLIEDVAEMVAPAAQEKDVEVCCQFDSNLPEITTGDGDRIRQIALNLASNAVKFTEKGQVVIKAGPLKWLDSEMMVLVEVIDTGIGVPDHSKDRLFKVFSQVDSSTTRRYGGTGLGLALSKRLTELHGGEIGCTSKVGEGSNFWFTVRLGYSKETICDIPRPFPISEMRALVVDDNLPNLDVVSLNLNRWGISCEVCHSAAEGLVELKAAAAKGATYDLVIIELQMEEMDGLGMAEEMRMMPLSNDTPIIMLTPIGQSVPPEDMARLNLSSSLNKPVRQSRLFNSIMSAVSPDRKVLEEDVANAEPESIIELQESDVRVLVAEDNPMNQAVIRGFMKKLGVDCTVASNGLKAVTAAEERDFDLIFMDCQMPIMGGVRATQKIREAEERDGGLARGGDRIPIVALTAHALVGDREKCLSAGMDDYLTKPMNSQALVSMLRKHVGESTSQLPMIEGLVS